METTRLSTKGQIVLPKDLRSSRAWGPGTEFTAIRDAFVRLLGLNNVRTEDPHAVANALALTGQGVDFADPLHVSSRPAGTMFATFDQSFVRRMKRAGMPHVVIPHV